MDRLSLLFENGTMVWDEVIGGPMDGPFAGRVYRAVIVRVPLTALVTTWYASSNRRRRDHAAAG